MLSVEDGRGIDGVDAYVSCLQVDLYAENYGRHDWEPLTEAEKEVFIRKATQFIDGSYASRFTGTRKTALQSLAWPRVGATIGGVALPDCVVPTQVQNATCEAALLLHEGQELYAESGAQIKVETVDAISTEFFATPDATTAPVVDAILAPVLKPSGACSILIRMG